MENPKGWGGGPIWNSLRGRGLDIFWNYTLDKNMWKCYEKPVNQTVKKHVNCSISHVFSHGFHTFFTGCETIETLWTGHFSQGQNLCETLWKSLWVFNLWKYLWKTRCKKPLNFHIVFYGVENLKTCEAFFHGQNLWKNSEMGGVYLAAVWRQNNTV